MGYVDRFSFLYLFTRMKDLVGEVINLGYGITNTNHHFRVGEEKIRYPHQGLDSFPPSLVVWPSKQQETNHLEVMISYPIASEVGIEPLGKGSRG